jgi:hypothetical protein
MNKKNTKIITWIIILVAIVLIAGSWFVFGQLSTETVAQGSAEEIRKAVEVEKIKKLAEENLIFFPLSGDESVLDQLRNSPQYKSLMTGNTFISLDYQKNSYPFKPLEELESEE